MQLWMFDGWNRLLNAKRGQQCVELQTMPPYASAHVAKFTGCSMNLTAFWKSNLNEYINLKGQPIVNVEKSSYGIDFNGKGKYTN